MQGLCNNIYDNAHEIIGWYPNEGNNNVDTGTDVTADVSDVGTRENIMSEGEAKMVHGTYLPIPSSL